MPRRFAAFLSCRRLVILAVLFLWAGGFSPWAAEGTAEPVVAAAAAVAAGDNGEPAVEAPAGAEPAPETKPVETPEQEAARLEAEHRERREQERKEILAEAEHFVETADETIIRKVPYPLNLLFSVRIFGVTLWRYVVSAGLVVFAVFLIFLITRHLKNSGKVGEAGKSGRWRTAAAVAAGSSRNALKLVILGIALRLASNLVVTVYHPDIVWFSGFLIFCGFIVYLFELVGMIDQVYVERAFHGNRLMETVRPIALKMVRFAIIFVAGMQVYQSVTGQPMFSVLAGLGIGGLALALASQETLQNLLGFASIAFDKSFLVGDAVSIAGNDGTVEHVGMRSMRIRAYNGNTIIIPNSAAVASSIVNLNRRPFIRKEIRIALSTLNSYEKIEEAMEGIASVVGEHDGKLSGLPPVVRFVDFEPARFVIQVYFWYDPEKPFFWDECSRVNLAICKRLSELGILYAER